MPKFFINHPVFAWVIAILISLGGVLAIRTLPIELVGVLCRRVRRARVGLGPGRLVHSRHPSPPR